MDAADERIAFYFDRMDYWWNYCTNCNGVNLGKKLDSFRNASGRIYDYVENIIVQNPQAMVAEFPRSKEKGMHYVNSEDNKLRIFSWQARTEHWGRKDIAHRVVAGFVTDRGTKYRDIANGTEGGICTGIVTIRTKDSLTVYLATYYTFDSADKSETVKAYSIMGDVLKEVSIFKDGDKSPKHLWCRYGFPLGYARDTALATHFSEDYRKIFLPVVESIGHQSVLTGMFAVYVFNGYAFIRDRKTN